VNVIHEKFGRIFATFINQWDQLINFKTYNWTEWSWFIIRISYENDVIMGAYELEFILFGIGVRFRYCLPIKTPEMLKLEDQLAQLDAGTLKTVPWEEVHGPFMEGRCPRCYFKVDGSEKEEEKNEEDPKS
jgi:hypothetical protein